MKTSFLLTLLMLSALPASNAMAGGSRTYLQGIAQDHFEKTTSDARENLLKDGFQKWDWVESQSSPCADCEIAIVPLKMELQSPEIYEFIKALESEKPVIMKLYKTSGNDYNLLAHMAVGILGRESAFFRARRYKFKEDFPSVIRALKVAEDIATLSFDGPSPSSRGPTQIKNVPTLIAEHYGVTKETLSEPKNAAVSTMGYLCKALKQLRSLDKDGKIHSRNRETDEIETVALTPENTSTLLPYLYFGSTNNNKLLTGDNRPWRNLYINEMKRFMTWVEVYERP